MAKRDVVLNADTGVYRYLDALGAGSKVTIFTRGEKPKGSRTNCIAVLVKEEDDWDWIPKEMRVEIHTIGEGVVSTTDLAAFLTSDADLWASVNEVVKRT